MLCVLYQNRLHSFSNLEECLSTFIRAKIMKIIDQIKDRIQDLIR